MQHASAEAHTQEFTAPVASVLQIDRRPWPARVRDACRDAGLPTTTRLVGVIIASHFNHDGTWAMSIDQIADECGIHRRKVFDHLAVLTKKLVIARKSGGGAFRSIYGPGEKVCTMAPTHRETKAAAPVPVPVAAPVSIREAGSGSQSTSSEHNSTDSTGPTKPRHDPRDDDRYTCSQCRRTWPQKYGETCHGCGGRAIEAINADIAAQARIDRKQAARLQAEIDNRPVTCNRCAYQMAKRADLADIGRCSHCMTLTDIEAADLLKRGKALCKRMVQAWNDLDHVRCKAAAEQAVALYAHARERAQATAATHSTQPKGSEDDRTVQGLHRVPLPTAPRTRRDDHLPRV